MFKKSNIPGDKTPKQDTKETDAKVVTPANESAPAAEKTATPAADVKTS